MGKLMNDEEKLEALRKEASRIEEDATYSSKGHFEDAKIWSTVHLGLGIPTAITAGISGVSAFGEHLLIAGSLAILAGALASVITFLNPSETASSHHNSGVKYNALRNRARFFREIEMENLPSRDDKVGALKHIAEQKDELNEISLQISRGSFERARKGIEEGEADYQADQQ